MSAKDKYDIFLSYSLKDQDWVSEFAAALKEAGLRPWFDASQIRPGERWKEKVQDALRESRTLVIVLTPNNIDDPNKWVPWATQEHFHRRIKNSDTAPQDDPTTSIGASCRLSPASASR